MRTITRSVRRGCWLAVGTWLVLWQARVLFAPDTGYEVEIRADHYLILRERDVQAVASARTEGQTGLYL